jgi:hypothetical protein
MILSTQVFNLYKLIHQHPFHNITKKVLNLMLLFLIDHIDQVDHCDRVVPFDI